jgi:hypothetical protein
MKMAFSPGSWMCSMENLHDHRVMSGDSLEKPKCCSELKLRYVLNGEVDKKGHPFLEELKASGKIPDLLVHTPGDMDGNYAIIEVKPGDVEEKAIAEDLKKLTHFVTEWRYQKAIFLVYGGQDVEALETFVRVAAESLDRIAHIEFWHHAELLKPAAYRFTL